MLYRDFDFQDHDLEAREPIRVAISGAAGHIGYSLVFRIAAGGLFGAAQPVRLSLLEAPSGMRALSGVELELRDCAFPLLHDVRLSDQPEEAFADADWIILLVGAPVRHAQTTRLDLLRETAPLYAAHGRAINHVSPHARVLVVGEPCNTNCLVALSEAPDVPPEHWFALNRLDRMRATALIAEKAGVPVSRVNRVCVWGNHSEKIYVDFHNTFIGQTPAPEVIQDPDWVRNVLQSTVQRRNRQIFELRGASPSATAAQSILGTIRSLTTPTTYQYRFGAAVLSDGSYGIPHRLVFGFPLRTEDGRTWSIVRDLYLDDEAQARLEENVTELQHEAAVVGL